VFYGKDTVKGRVDLYIEVPLSNLKFKKNQADNTFEVTLDYTVNISNASKEVYANFSYSEVIKNTNEEQKNVNEMSDFIIKQYYLNPGRYTLKISLRQKNTTIEASQEVNFTVKDFTLQDYIFSDIMILADYKENEGGKKSITPLVNNNIGNLNEFNIFFEIFYGEELPYPAEFTYTISNNKEKNIEKGDLSYILQPGDNKEVEKIPTTNLIMGDYRLDIFQKKTGDTVASKNFHFRWGDLPPSITNIDTAITEMIYIASEDEIKYIRAGKTASERARRFIKFWRNQDPNPSAPKNRIMIAYYNRVAIANQRYSQYYRAGWNTDMGMVYVIYGEPSSIDRHPFTENEKPYEIWEYYDINKRFIFVDEIGMGEYRLITPIWDKRATRL
jgi:GWxTD domain-containing protein